MHVALIVIACWFAVSVPAGIFIGKAIKGPGKDGSQ